MVGKGFEKIFDNTSGGIKCNCCRNKVWAFSQFQEVPVLTCTHCGFTKKVGTNEFVDTSGYMLTKRYKNEWFWEHVWELVKQCPN